ncbi:D-erythrulose reductase-like [Ruditapes philippinarum]|uniref:D-erythrulose reductase-like n=1 Tax=Ruditapes philippinarum TaxID=129788 RepID=UPI00295BECBB|nr:D-erythrulose reductase-like [Ruditapes philippinarum]
MPFDFRGKKVLVTGAGKGIGRGVAIALNKAGSKVYALSRTKSTLDSLVEECPDIIPIVADLCDWEDTREKLEQLEVLDGLVNNAGIGGHDYDAVDCPKEYIKHILDNNLLSAINCSQVVAKKMIESKVKGSIINCSSVGSLAAYPRALPYSVSKAGMDMVTKQFALELGPNGIRVNSVNPAVVYTPLVQNLVENGTLSLETVINNIPMGRILTMEDIVDPIMYLLSDHSAMVTGQMHVVDGGCMSSLIVKV